MNNFNLGDEVWWFDATNGQLKLHHAKIHGIKWYCATLKKRTKIFFVEYDQIHVSQLYKSKIDALEAMITQLQNIKLES